MPEIKVYIDQDGEIQAPCQYKAMHGGSTDPVPATLVIDCGPVGMVPACPHCAKLYVRLGGDVHDVYELEIEEVP